MLLSCLYAFSIARFFYEEGCIFSRISCRFSTFIFDRFGFFNFTRIQFAFFSLSAALTDLACNSVIGGVNPRRRLYAGCLRRDRSSTVTVELITIMAVLHKMNSGKNAGSASVSAWTRSISKIRVGCSSKA